MDRKQIESPQEHINFYIEQAKMLSLPFEEQIVQLPDFARWNIASDMANDWRQGDLEKLNQLFGKQLISERAISLHDEINKNFDNVSCGGALFEEIIWERDGVKSHSFWENQRKLAKELLTELGKV